MTSSLASTWVRFVHNSGGKIGIPDAGIGLRIAVGIQQATVDQLTAGDLNGNGRIESPR